MAEPDMLQPYKFDTQGLIPAVIQDWRDGTVLMLGYMNRDALSKTLQTKSVHFWSRSRGTLWEKGETSGHRLLVKEIYVDCDHDTVLVKAHPVGPTCHTGERACFFTEVGEDGMLGQEKTQSAAGGLLEGLYRTILERRAHPHPGSYTAKLFEEGHDRILKKVVEEAGEVVLAAKNGKKDEIIYEVADLLFHTLVVLGYHDVGINEIYEELAKRMGKSGVRQPQGGTP